MSRTPNVQPARIASPALAAALALFVPSGVEAATILARCGPSTGESYYFEAGIAGPGRGGWKKDGIDDGRITAYINDNQQLDILQRDTTGTKSYLKEGYKVALINFSQQDRSLLISAYGENFSETFLFKVSELGVGTLAWTASKVAPLVIRTSIMTAECGPKYALDR
ncbi:hypothetical protein [Methylobacterium sp. sgz302541]|uniref:hypothetical protein n=1 Tax=unclassified Methylobacterium TaxID=2615210 RepID=UPI003D34DA84